jgi:aminomethyltransferase
MTTEIHRSIEEFEELELPLDAWHRAKGARMVSFADYLMPLQYEGIMAEHLWTRKHAGLFDVSHMGQVLLTGEDPDKALELVVPGEIQKLGLNQLRYTLLLNDKGGIVDDLMVTRREKDIFLVVNGATKFNDMAYLLDALPEEVVITHLDERSLLALQGPQAADVLTSLVPEVGDLYFMQSGRFPFEGMNLWISRSGYTGEDGFEISVANDDVEALADRLCAHEAVKPIGLGARDSLRLEAGLPLYGHDLDEDITPVAADLTFTLAKRRREEADFAGAEQILKEYPDKSTLVRVGIVVDGRQPLREGSDIVDQDGKVIGNVTSGGFSPSLQRPIGMAYIPRALSGVGTPLQAVQRGKTLTATVAAMPFLPHRYHRAPKSG